MTLKGGPGSRSRWRSLPDTSGVVATVVVATGLGSAVGIAAALILASLLASNAGRCPGKSRQRR